MFACIRKEVRCDRFIPILVLAGFLSVAPPVVNVRPLYTGAEKEKGILPCPAWARQRRRGPICRSKPRHSNGDREEHVFLLNLAGRLLN
jgi:hypothetical protein